MSMYLQADADSDAAVAGAYWDAYADRDGNADEAAVVRAYAEEQPSLSPRLLALWPASLRDGEL